MQEDTPLISTDLYFSKGLKNNYPVANRHLIKLPPMILRAMV